LLLLRRSTSPNRRGRRLASRVDDASIGRRHSACPAPHRLPCPLRVKPFHRAQHAQTTPLPLPCAQHSHSTPSSLFPPRAESIAAALFPAKSSSPVKSLAIVHLRPIHCTRNLLSTSQGDPELFPVNPTLHRPPHLPPDAPPTTPRPSPSHSASSSASTIDLHADPPLPVIPV